MNTFVFFLIALTAGFTASGIVANLYRIADFTAETTLGHFLRVVILMFSGPSEIFEWAVEARMSGRWTAVGFWLAISGVFYWSLVLGLAVIHGANDFFVAA